MGFILFLMYFYGKPMFLFLYRNYTLAVSRTRLFDECLFDYNLDQINVFELILVV